MPLEAVEHRRLYRQVADQLRSLIEEGEFAPGSRLPAERELAEKLGISRPTLREALIALEVEGRIRIRIGSGIYVAQAARPAPSMVQAVQAEGPFEVLHARELIEAAIAGEAARKATSDGLAELRAILDIMAGAHHPSLETVRLDRAFHVTIAGILDNGLLARMVGELFDQRVNPYFTQLASYFENTASWALAIAEHRRVHDCIAAGDAEGAAQAMRHHLQASQERFSESFGDGARPRSGRAKRPAGKKPGQQTKQNPREENR